MMNLPSRACNEFSLQRLLSVKADIDDQITCEVDDTTPWVIEILEHLEICETCQTRLAELAATDNQWNKAKNWLQGYQVNGALRAPYNSSSGHRQDTSNSVWSKTMAEQLLSPPSHPEMLGRIGRYEVERLIGSGGMGIVFKAYDSDLNRPVAIKVLAPHLAGNGAARQRFAREAKAAAAVVHEHVVPIHNVETNSVSPYLVMHYVAGESLQSRIDRVGALDTCEILRISMQIAMGLAAAHAHGLVHRDIKPPNILLEHGVERSLLTDFGLARTADDASLTNSGVQAGTPQYMSPEQAKGETLDSRSDLFSLGSTMYAMCTGRPPFRSETAYGILRKIVETEPHSIRDLNPAIPGWLCKIVASLMRKDADARIASASELASLLAKCLAHLQMPLENPLPDSLRDDIPITSTVQINRMQPMRFRFILMTLSFICILAIGSFKWSSWSGFMSGKPSSRHAVNDDAENVGDSGTPYQQPIMDHIAIRPSAEDAILEKLASTRIETAQGLSPKGLVAVISEQIEVPCIWNDRSFEESLDILTMMIDWNGRLTSREALELVCDSIGGAYIVHEKSIEICSREYAQTHPVIRYYDLKHVLNSNQQMKSVVNAVESIIELNDETPSIRTPISLIGSVLTVRTTEVNHTSIEQLLSTLAMSLRKE